MDNQHPVGINRTTLLDALCQLNAAGVVSVMTNGAPPRDIDDEIGDVGHEGDDGRDYAVIDHAIYPVRADGVVESVPAYRGTR